MLNDVDVFITFWSLFTFCFFPSCAPNRQPFPSGFQAKSLLCWATMVPASPPPCRRFAVWQLQPKAGDMEMARLGPWLPVKGKNIEWLFFITWWNHMKFHVDLVRFIAGRWYFSLRPQCTQWFGGGSQIYGILSAARRSLPSILAQHGHSPHQKHHLHLKSSALGHDSHSTCGALFSSGGQVS